MKLWLYFGIAIGSNLLLQTNPPASPWECWRWIASGLLQGLIAIKAYQSPPPIDIASDTHRTYET